MGKPKFGWAQIPLAKNIESQIIKIDQFELFCVSMGNPHGVIFFDDEDDLNKVDIESIGNLVTPSLKQKIQLEAEESNLMKPKGKLPI